MDNTYQTVYVTLNNGDVGAFHGPTLINEETPNLFVTDVQFSQPKPLPSDCSWEAMKGPNDSENDNKDHR